MPISKPIIETVAELQTLIAICQMERDRRNESGDTSLSDNWVAIADDVVNKMTNEHPPPSKFFSCTWGEFVVTAKHILEAVDDFETFIWLCIIERDRRNMSVDRSLSDDWGVIADDLTSVMKGGQIIKIAASDELCQLWTLQEVSEYIAGEDVKRKKVTISLWGMSEACLRAAARKHLHERDEERARRQEKK